MNKSRLLVTLKPLDAFTSLIRRLNLPLGEFAGLFEGGQLLPEFIEDNESLSGHVLLAATLAIRLDVLA
jgi:hypothetical protein